MCKCTKDRNRKGLYKSGDPTINKFHKILVLIKEKLVIEGRSKCTSSYILLLILVCVAKFKLLNDIIKEDWRINKERQNIKWRIRCGLGMRNIPNKIDSTAKIVWTPYQNYEDSMGNKITREK